jgi:hypothetical protein
MVRKILLLMINRVRINKIEKLCKKINLRI